MNSKKDSLEVSSTQIHTDLREIKERVAAVETIISLANRHTVEAYARSVITSQDVKRIVAACETPKTKAQLQAQLGYASVPALDHHLNQVRKHDILQQDSNDDGKLTFQWSNLFARLPQSIREDILGTLKTGKSSKVVARKSKHGYSEEEATKTNTQTG